MIEKRERQKKALAVVIKNKILSDDGGGDAVAVNRRVIYGRDGPVENTRPRIVKN